MSKVIAIVNNKGGVGKTTTTEHLGIGLAKAGYKVLLIDADPQRSLSKALGEHSLAKNEEGTELSLGTLMDGFITNNHRAEVSDCIIGNAEGICLMPAGMELANIELKLSFAMMRESIFKNCIADIRDSYDYILVDGSPSLNMMMINILNAADTVLIPYNAEYLAEAGIAQLISVIANVKRQMNPKLAFEGVLATMFDNVTNNAKKIVGDVLEALEGFPYIRPFEVMIPDSVKATEASGEGVSVYLYAPKNPVSEAYIRLTMEIIANDHPEFTKEMIEEMFIRIMKEITNTDYVPKLKARTVILREQELCEFFPEDYSAGKIKKCILELLGETVGCHKNDSCEEEEEI